MCESRWCRYFLRPGGGGGVNCELSPASAACQEADSRQQAGSGQILAAQQRHSSPEDLPFVCEQRGIIDAQTNSAGFVSLLENRDNV